MVDRIMTAFDAEKNCLTIGKANVREYNTTDPGQIIPDTEGGPRVGMVLLLQITVTVSLLR